MRQLNFTSGTTTWREWGNEGSGNGQFLFPIGITTIKELDKELNNASKWGKGILVKFDKIFHKINPNKDIFLDANPFGILIVLLFYAKKPRVSKKILNQTGLKKTILETIKELLKIK